MRYKKTLGTMAVAMSTIFCASHACAELTFDGTKFSFKAAEKSGSGPFEKITQTYEAQGDNKHQCKMFVYPRPKSSVAGIIGVDKAVMRPPVTIVPLEVVNKPSQKYKEDAASIILIASREDSAKYKVILHRATLLKDDLVRELQIECPLSYSGFFGKSISEFEHLKDAWLSDLFELDPEISSL